MWLEVCGAQDSHRSLAAHGLHAGKGDASHTKESLFHEYFISIFVANYFEYQLTVERLTTLVGSDWSLQGR